MINQDMRLFLRISYLLAMASAMPMQVNVNQRATECLYEKVDAGEAVTMSVFLLSGSELKATVYIEGPIAPPGVNSGLELQTSINEYNTGQRFGQVVKEQFVVDMEHLQATPEAEEIKDDDDAFKYDDDDDDDDATEKSEQDLEKARKRMEEKRRRAQIARQKAREMRRKREQQRKERAAKIREEGEPVQKTITAKTDGWYRACIMGSWFQIAAELEMRKASDLGGIDGETGHVFTYEKQLFQLEEQLLDEDSASDEEGIDEKDFEKTREMLRRLRRLLSDIQSKQMQERHRLLVHKTTNEHSHARMVMGSLFQTVLFIAVTAFQVYTIRKWFSGSQLLAR